MKKILIFLTITVLLAACSSDSDPAVTNDGRRVPLQVTGYIADTPLGITRAAGSAWEADDQIGVYAVESNTTKPIEDGSNVCYSTSSGGETSVTLYLPFTTSTPIILPSSGNIDVYGYYPYSAKKKDGTTNFDPEHVEIDVSTQSIDLMTTDKVSTTTHGGTTPISISNPSCELLFQHRLTKLVFNLNLSEMGTIKEIALNIGSQRTAATYNIYDDKLSCTGDANKAVSAVTLETASTVYNMTFEAIVLPNNDTKVIGNENHPITITGNPAVDRTVTIVVDGRSYTFTIAVSGADSSNKVITPSFASGNKYVYNVKVYPFTIEVNPQNYTEQW